MNGEYDALVFRSVNTEAGNLKRHPKSIWTGVYLDDMACNQSNSFFAVGSVFWIMPTAKRKRQMKMRSEAMRAGYSVKISSCEAEKYRGGVSPDLLSGRERLSEKKTDQFEVCFPCV